MKSRRHMASDTRRTLQTIEIKVRKLTEGWEQIEDHRAVSQMTVVSASLTQCVEYFSTMIKNIDTTRTENEKLLRDELRRLKNNVNTTMPKEGSNGRE